MEDLLITGPQIHGDMEILLITGPQIHGDMEDFSSLVCRSQLQKRRCPSVRGDLGSGASPHKDHICL
ncbi:unnamed protein product [Merluccius merluccius]